MPSGGARPGAGRPKGSRTGAKTARLTRAEIVAEAVARGLSPLEYLLLLMRDSRVPATRRDWAAATALPFCHPELALTAVQNQNTPRTVNNHLQIELVLPEDRALPGETIDALPIEKLPQ